GLLEWLGLLRGRRRRANLNDQTDPGVVDRGVALHLVEGRDLGRARAVRILNDRVDYRLGASLRAIVALLVRFGADQDRPLGVLDDLDGDRADDAVARGIDLDVALQDDRLRQRERHRALGVGLDLDERLRLGVGTAVLVLIAVEGLGLIGTLVDVV